MVCHIDPAVSSIGVARCHGGHISASEHERSHGVAVCSEAGVRTCGELEFSIGSLTCHRRCRGWNNHSSVKEHRHPAVRAVSRRFSIDSHIFEIGTDDLARRNVIDDEPGAVASEDDFRRTTDRSCVGCDMDIDGIITVDGHILHQAIVNFTDSLGIRINI